MDDSTTDDNPLTVNQAMALITKWETHPGLLMAIFDAARKLRDEVELQRDEKASLQTELDQLRAVVAQNNQSLAQIVTRWIKPGNN